MNTSCIPDMLLVVLIDKSQLVAHSVATYAISFKGFPKRTGVKVNTVTESLPYHGPKLVM